MMMPPQLQRDEKSTTCLFRQGNEELRKGDYGKAITQYGLLMAQKKEIPKYLSANLQIAKNKYRICRRTFKKPSVGVCGWDLAHNAAGRVYTLVNLYETFTNVEIVGSIFPCHGREIWEPIRDTQVKKNIFIVEDESKFIKQAIQLVAMHPFDIIHLSKPRVPNIIFGCLYKLLWNAKVLMDIDDEELTFVGGLGEITVEEYIKNFGALPKLSDLHGESWTRLSVGLAKGFDGVTVVNRALQQRYGGQIVSHARNELDYQNTAKQRPVSRARFGIESGSKVVLFLGTPRVHKGLLETAQAIASLDRRDIVYAIVGDFPDIKLKEQLQAITGVHYVFIGNQPFGAVSQVIAMADVCVLWQDSQSITTQYQTPAKLSDALAGGLPVLATETLPLAEAFRDGAVLPIDKNNLSTQLVRVLDNDDILKELRHAGIDFFRRKLSLSINADQIRQVVTHCETKPLSIEVKNLTHNINDTFLSSFLSIVKREEKIRFSPSTHSEVFVDQKIAIAVQVDCPDLWSEMVLQLHSLSVPFDLFVTTTLEHAKVVESIVRRCFPHVRIDIQPTLGLDIIPFLRLVPTLVSEDYVTVCRLQTKKRENEQNNSGHCVVLDTLMADAATFLQIAAAFVRDPLLQMAGPVSLYFYARKIILKNDASFEAIFQHLEGCDQPGSRFEILGETMFWVRPTLLEKLSKYVLQDLDQFEIGKHENGQITNSILPLLGLLPVMQHCKIGLLYPSHSIPMSILQIGQDFLLSDQDLIGNLIHQYAYLDKDSNELRNSRLFDSNYYRQQYSDLLSVEIDLIRHYLLIGRFQGKTPNPDFNPNFYRSHHADQIYNKEDPFLNYLRHGVKEGLLLRSTKELEDQDTPSFRFRVLNVTMIDWNALAKAKRNPDQVSIIIPVYNNPEFTRVCIASLYKYTPVHRFELIVVDNGSDFTTRNMLDQFADQYSNLIIRHNKENLNFALGCNIGFASSHGERVLFLNNDTTVTANWLEPMLEPLDRPEISVVQPLLLFPDGKIQCAGVVFSNKTPLGYPIYAGYQPEPRLLRPDRQFKAVSAACMMVRATDFCACHGFDPIFINGQEDIDLCLRLNTDGRYAHVVISSKVIHHESQTQSRYKYTAYNRRIFTQRWQRKICCDDDYFYKEDKYTVSKYEPDTHLTDGQLPIYRPILLDGLESSKH